jgi:hypothetical protein
MKNAEWGWAKDWGRVCHRLVVAFAVAAAWTTKSRLIPKGTVSSEAGASQPRFSL